MNKIDNILNHYFEGLASPEEEVILKNYFLSDDISPQHTIYKPLFDAFEEEKQIEAPVFKIPTVHHRKKIAFSRKIWIAAASVAAAVLVLITLFPIKNNTQIEAEYVVFIHGKKITNPREAQLYADKMFAETDAFMHAAYEPFIEAKTMKQDMDADKIFENVSKQIKYIESLDQ